MPRRLIIHVVLIALALVVAIGSNGRESAPGRWMAGDFHQHSYFTDGRNRLADVLGNGVNYGLDWEANSEHGGAGARDGEGNFWDDTSVYSTSPVRGDEVQSGDHRGMWRWQSLIEFAFPIIQTVRGENPKNLIATGLEWNVPGHEHCSVGIVANNAAPIGEFEYRFDRADNDTSGGLKGLWPGKQFNQDDHQKAVEAAKWLQANHRGSGWMVFAHPERVSSYTAADFRDLNDAGPDVAFGFEGLPGHQKQANRGGYRARAVGKGTYGGAGVYIAKVGGLWDSLLGEGRHWWTFVSSDFHSTGGDFWPGQYAKTWTYVPDSDRSGSFSLTEVAAGLRSGNTFCVHGDLIDALDIRAESQGRRAGMGETLQVRAGRRLDVNVRFRSPQRNDHGDRPQVRTVQLIAGRVRPRASKFLEDGTTLNPDYERDTNESTRVVATYRQSDLRQRKGGWYETPTYRLKKLDGDMYFRIRGSSLPPNTPRETDAVGNPLADSEQTGLDPEEAAWSDLWFYSNPIFVESATTSKSQLHLDRRLPAGS